MQAGAVQKSAEELKRQQERDAQERAKVIASRVPQLSIDGLDQSQYTARSGVQCTTLRSVI